MTKALKILSLLLLTACFSFNRGQAQNFYQFLLQVPVYDTVNGGQWAFGQQLSTNADPSFTGIFFSGGYPYVNNNGIFEDSVFISGPGTGTLILSTIDCYGDTLRRMIPFDSSFTTFVADTVFLCGSNNATCTANFTINNKPGTPNVSFVGSSTGTGVITQIFWTFGDGSNSSSPNPSHTYVNNGNYYVTYYVTYSTGCAATISQMVTILGGAVVCTSSILPAQIGNALNFYVNYTASGTPVNFDWDFGDGHSQSTSNNGIIHPYAATGTYNVCVVTTFSDGCIDSTCQLNSISLGNQGSCNAWFSHGNNGQVVSFEDSSTVSSAVNFWWWDFGDGSTDSVSGPIVSHTYAGPGPYVARLEIFTVDTCYAMAIDTIDVLQQGSCAASFSHSPDTSGQYSILAYNNAVGNNLSYFWDFGDGGSSTQPYPVHQYAGAGTYQVCLSVAQTSPACADTFCSTVVVTQKQAAAYTFGVWNPTATAIDPQTAEGSLRIAPQPAQDFLTLLMPSDNHAGRSNIRIYSTQGQLLVDRSHSLAVEKTQIDVRDLPNGMYILRVGHAAVRFWVVH